MCCVKLIHATILWMASGHATPNMGCAHYGVLAMATVNSPFPSRHRSASPHCGRDACMVTVPVSSTCSLSSIELQPNSGRQSFRITFPSCFTTWFCRGTKLQYGPSSVTSTVAPGCTCTVSPLLANDTWIVDWGEGEGAAPVLQDVSTTHPTIPPAARSRRKLPIRTTCPTSSHQ